MVSEQEVWNWDSCLWNSSISIWSVFAQDIWSGRYQHYHHHCLLPSLLEKRALWFHKQLQLIFWDEMIHSTLKPWPGLFCVRFHYLSLSLKLTQRLLTPAFSHCYSTAKCITNGGDSDYMHHVMSPQAMLLSVRKAYLSSCETFDLSRT